MLGPEGADAIDVVRGQRETEQHGRLDPSHNSHKPTAQVDEGARGRRLERVARAEAMIRHRAPDIDVPSDVPSPTRQVNWTIVGLEVVAIATVVALIAFRASQSGRVIRLPVGLSAAIDKTRNVTSVSVAVHLQVVRGTVTTRSQNDATYTYQAPDRISVQAAGSPPIIIIGDAYYMPIPGKPGNYYRYRLGGPSLAPGLLFVSLVVTPGTAVTHTGARYHIRRQVGGGFVANAGQDQTIVVGPAGYITAATSLTGTTHDGIEERATFSNFNAAPAVDAPPASHTGPPPPGQPSCPITAQPVALTCLDIQPG
jgi:hypothetical protein